MMKDNLAQRLEALTVLDTEGHPVVLGSLWARRSRVLVFVRHFG